MRPSSRRPWLPLSARDWTASARNEADPVIATAISWVTAIPRFAPSAARTALKPPDRDSVALALTLSGDDPLSVLMAAHVPRQQARCAVTSPLMRFFHNVPEPARTHLGNPVLKVTDHGDRTRVDAIRNAQED